MDYTDGASSFDQLFVEYGVSGEYGFRRPHIDEIWRVAVREAERAFGSRLTAPTSLELQYIEAIVLWTDTYFESLESAYYSAFYQTAQGVQLDRLLALMGFERLPERQATGEVTIFAAGGTSGAPSRTPIPAGTRVTTTRDLDADRVIFQTTEPAAIPEGETKVERVPIRGLDPLTASISLSDEQTGVETNVPPGAIDTFYDSVQGTAGVTNPLPTGSSGERADGSSYSFVTGRDRETDAAFRRRYEAAQAIGGAATLTAVTASIRNADDGTIVQAVDVDETLEITQNADGTYSGRQIEPIVVLEKDTTANRQAVGQAIFDARAAGIESVGSVEVFAETSDGTAHNRAEGFDIALDREVYVDADILVTETFPTGGEDLIKENVVNNIGGYTVDGDRITGEFEGIGGDVYYSQVVGAIIDNDIEGIIDIDGTSFGDAIQVDTADPPTASANIAISEDETAITRPENITINTSVATPQ